MFGRIIINKGELKFKEYDIYKAHYCGICASLKKRGFLSAMCLNYDMTFLALLLNSLYDCENKCKNARCVCHVCKKHLEITDKYSDYVADMTILLAYYKCLDDFYDDKNLVKYIYSLYLNPRVKKIVEKYPQKSNNIKQYLESLAEAEKTPQTEECANLFGQLLGEVFTPEDDIWRDILYKMGFFMGKFIYIADAFDDIEDDIKKNRPNPLKEMYGKDGFETECEIILNMMATECAAEFEKLPIIENAEILRNIIYSGIWQQKAKKKS